MLGIDIYHKPIEEKKQARMRNCGPVFFDCYLVFGRMLSGSDSFLRRTRGVQEPWL